MTNKKAIETLELVKSATEWDFPLDYQMAIDEAIEALECVNSSAFKDGWNAAIKEFIHRIYDKCECMNEGCECSAEKAERCETIIVAYNEICDIAEEMRKG